MANVKRNRPRKRINPLPDIPSKVDPVMRRWMESAKEAIEVRLGRRGDAGEAAITFNDLIDAGIVQSLGRLNPATGLPEVELPFPEEDELAVPGPVVNFQVTGMFGGIFLEWDLPNFGPTYYGVEVFRGPDQDFANAIPITISTGFTYFDPIAGPEAVTYYYWVRYLNANGQPGPMVGPEMGQTEASVEYLMDQLEGEINETLLAQTLRERIDLIDGVGGLVSQVDDLSDSTASLTTQVQVVGNNVSSLSGDVDTIEGEVQDLSQQYAAIQQQMSVEYNEVTGRLESIYALRINSNGRISGFGLADDGNESVFGVEANRFYVGGSSSSDRPFIISGGDTYLRSAFIIDGSIDSAKIANAAITEAKIANAAVDTAKISNLAVTAAKIKDGEITNAKIGTAAITRAKIGALAVDTLRIGDNAVTVPEYNTGSLRAGTGGWINDMVGIAIHLVEKSPVLVIWNFAQGYTSTSFKTWGFRVRYNGITAISRTGMEAKNDYPTGFVMRTMDPGYNIIYLDWIGQDSAIEARGSLLVLGVQK